jgi:hypothetical protein
MLTDSILQTDIEDVICRLRDKFEVSSNRALSEQLGLSQSGIAMAKKKSSLPYAAIVNACIQRQISLDDVFGIESERNSVDSAKKKIDESKRDSEDKDSHYSVADAVAANSLVEKILDDLMFTKNLPANKELFIRAKLRPVLFNKVFEYQFNEVMVKTVAEGALVML